MELPLLVAFGAGILAFVSPCVLPLVPVYLASICGPEMLESEVKKGRIPVFFHSLSFVGGFSLVFIILGLGVGLAGFALTSAPISRSIAGSLLIVFGLFVLGTLKFPWLNYEKRLTPSLGATTGYLRSLSIGAIFSLAWTPCIAGLLGGTLALALGSGTVWQGAYLLGIFSLGLGLPFIIIGLAFDSISPLLKRIRRYSAPISIASGLLLIAVGIAVVTGSLTFD
jgi:cytochrome c-type biogenesis protein